MKQFRFVLQAAVLLLEMVRMPAARAFVADAPESVVSDACHSWAAPVRTGLGVGMEVGCNCAGSQKLADDSGATRAWVEHQPLRDNRIRRLATIKRLLRPPAQPRVGSGKTTAVYRSAPAHPFPHTPTGTCIPP